MRRQIDRYHGELHAALKQLFLQAHQVVVVEDPGKYRLLVEDQPPSEKHRVGMVGHNTLSQLHDLLHDVGPNAPDATRRKPVPPHQAHIGVQRFIQAFLYILQSAFLLDRIDIDHAYLDEDEIVKQIAVRP